jgi:hypothetical protein
VVYLREEKGLGEEGGSPKVQGISPLLGARGEEDNRHRPLLMQLSIEGKAIHCWHLHIQQGQVNGLNVKEVQGLLSVRSTIHDIPKRFKRQAQTFSKRLVIVNEEKVWLLRSRHGPVTVVEAWNKFSEK